MDSAHVHRFGVIRRLVVSGLVAAVPQFGDLHCAISRLRFSMHHAVLRESWDGGTDYPKCGS
jgi:hypothetical protein